MSKQNYAFGNKLCEIREGKKLTQQQVADSLGITRVTYNRYETAQREPDTSMILKICNLLETTPDYLFGLREYKGSDIMAIEMSNYTGLSENTIEYLHSLVEKDNEYLSEPFADFDEDGEETTPLLYKDVINPIFTEALFSSIIEKYCSLIQDASTQCEFIEKELHRAFIDSLNNPVINLKKNTVEQKPSREEDCKRALQRKAKEIKPSSDALSRALPYECNEITKALSDSLYNNLVEKGLCPSQELSHQLSAYKEQVKKHFTEGAADNG